MRASQCVRLVVYQVNSVPSSACSTGWLSTSIVVAEADGVQDG